MSSCVTDFLNTACEQIKNKKIRASISAELNNHIEELSNSFTAEGMPRQQAQSKAVMLMGDPIEIGKSMNKIHRPKTEWSVVAMLIGLITVGVISVFFLSGGDLNSYEIKHQLMIYIVGIGILIGTIFIDYKLLEKFSLHIYIASCPIFILLLAFHTTGMYAQYYSPHSIIPIFCCLVIIAYSSLVKKYLTSNLSCFNTIKFLFASNIPIIIIARYSLSFTVIMLAVIVSVLFYGAFIYKKHRGKKFILFIGGCIGSVICIAATVFIDPYRFFHSYFINRLYSFIHYKDDIFGSGYLTHSINETLANSKLIGAVDISESSRNVFSFYLNNTDFAFINILSRFGVLFAILLGVLFCFLILRLFTVTFKIKDDYGKILIVAITTLLLLQACLHVLTNLNLFPPVAMSLPFISRGGTGFCCNMALVGLFFNIYRNKDMYALKCSA